MLVRVGGEACQEHPWLNCCYLLKAQLSSEQETGVVGSVHTVCMGSSVEQRLFWALGGDCRLLSLPSSCFPPACSPGTEPGSSLLLGWAPGCPQPLLVGEDAGGPGRKSRNNFFLKLQIHLSIDERRGRAGGRFSVETSPGWAELASAPTLFCSRKAQTHGCGSMFLSAQGLSWPKHPPRRSSAPACSSPSLAQAATATPRWEFWDAVGLDDLCRHHRCPAVPDPAFN